MEQPLYFTPIDMYAPAAALVTLAGIRRTGGGQSRCPVRGCALLVGLSLSSLRGCQS